MTRVIILIVLFVLLSGCRSEENAKADDKILWDKEGCAYLVLPHFGDTSFIRPVRDANRAECKQ